MTLAKAYLARDSADAQFVCDRLREEGIAAVIMGEHLQSLGGAIPLFATQPIIYVNEEDAGRAAKVVANIARRAVHLEPGERSSLWRCPICGEMHERQFSECWNCQTPRPESGESPETARASTASIAELTMDRGLLCTSCGYDLRGLPATHPCPECGYPVVGSVLETLTQDSLTDPTELDQVIRGPFEVVARDTGFPVDALLIICHAWLRSLLPMDRRMPGDPINPDDLCRFIGGYAMLHLGGRNEARKLFRRWGIVGDGQIARIGTALLAADLLPSQTPVDPAVLRGRLSLNDLFPAEG